MGMSCVTSWPIFSTVEPDSNGQSLSLTASFLFDPDISTHGGPILQRSKVGQFPLQGHSNNPGTNAAKYHLRQLLHYCWSLHYHLQLLLWRQLQQSLLSHLLNFSHVALQEVILVTLLKCWIPVVMLLLSILIQLNIYQDHPTPPYFSTTVTSWV